MPEGELDWDPELLRCVVHWRMPYGRFHTMKLIDLPEPYVVWMYRNALPEGKLGRVLALLFEIKVNGLEPMIRELARRWPPPEDGSDEQN